MEEIRGTEALEREILDDSARKAERTARKAREDAERIRRSSAADLEARIGELRQKHLDRLAEAQRERVSRLPLEKTRIRAAFVDRALRGAVSAYLDSLDDSAIGSWCATAIAARAGLFAGASVELRHRGVTQSSIEQIKKLLSTAAECRVVADPGLPRRGILAADGEGRLLVTLTEAQMEEILLGGKRGDLAAALLPSGGDAGPGEAGKP